MKKLVSVLLALAMIFAMSVTAFAAENDTPETYTLTFNGIKGHTYKVFQIYTGDIDKEDDKLVISNVKYGKNHYPIDGNVGDSVPEAELHDFISSEDPANHFKSQINSAEPYAVCNADGAASSAELELEAGYYLIVDVTTDLPDGQTKSPVLLKIAEETTITSKHASIVSTKKVDDKNDSVTDEDTVDWQDVADYDIGDDVPFQLAVTLPATLNTYDTYELTFHDQQDDGFADPENFNVYILKKDNTTKIDIDEAGEGTSGYKVLPCASDKCEFGGCSFTVQVGDIKELYGQNTFEDGDKIIVEYTAQLTEAANVGRAGNENGMYVCHPDGHTPKDYVTVLTYELKINKIDGDSKEALTGAGFTLYKWDAATNAWNEGTEIVAGENVSTFTWTGIDGGKYKLVETTTPAGYNTIADIEFVVDATHKTVWLADGNSAFEDLIAKNPAGTVVVFADRDTAGNEDGKLEGNIANFKGVVLPETGAAGTMMLIGISSLFVMIAVVFMVTRKKMSIYED